MVNKNHDFLKKLLATFKVETGEHIKALTAGLLALEKTPAAGERMQIVEAIFREAHSLKGAARAVNMTEIEALCRSLESVFAAWQRNEVSPSAELFDLLHQTVDGLSLLLASTDSDRATPDKDLVRELSENLEKALRESLLAAEQKTPEKRGQEASVIPRATPSQLPMDEGTVAPETVRIATTKLDAVLLQAEELLAAKLVTGRHAAEIRETSAALAGWKREWAKIQPEVGTIRRAFEKNGRDGAAGNERFTKTLEFLSWNHHAITEIDNKLAALERSAGQDHRMLGAMVDGLLVDMKRVLMLPFGSILETFPSLVRNLSRDQGKEVELLVEGGEIEVDRRILEEMKDPLTHLVRNCFDHGIEKLEEREKKQKPRRGTIRIAITQKNGGKMEVLISDDGRGIDLGKVRSSALRLGLITEQEAETLNDQEALSLVFRSGVSTSPMITDLSGRGLGLAIVREKAEKLGGAVAVESRVSAGTAFYVVLPLTIATFRGIPVRVGKDLFVLPSAQVERVARAEKRVIKTVENRETIEVNGQTVSLVHLGDVLELPRKTPTEDSRDTILVVLITHAEQRIAFIIDEVLDEQEVLVKGLGKQLSRVRNVAGATVLATRELAPILNVSDLLKSAVKASSARIRPAAAPFAEEKAKRKSLLVVEDSITARSLLKSILEAAGYEVKTAVDGVDGFTQLRSGEFDIVVSDVDMPRMSGFDLTAKIRAEKRVSDLPVVLVTALESREDRERGIDVGANAYIVKSSFDQSNLLEVIRRLI
ncbi:MAG: response regulator [Deltaproteobacteria bacterium]|nr:response regulator [Deltaproteobacteria bacterium]